MEINAAVHRTPGQPPTIETLHLEEPRVDEILVQMCATGVCHTDYAFADRDDLLPTPIVLGHEGAGVVEAVGAAVTDLRPGDKVVLSIDSCGGCRSCLKGSPAYCDEMALRHFSGGRPDGTSPLSDAQGRVNGMFFAQSSFATYALAPARAAVKVSTQIPLEMLGPLGCGIQTGAGAVFNIFQPQLGDSIAIFGAGSVGLSAIMAASAANAGEIIAVDRVDSRLELALELGATQVINANRSDAVATIQKMTGGVDYAFDNTGNTQVIRQAFDSLGSKGELAIATAEGELSFDGFSILTGKSVRGVLEGNSVPRRFIPQLIELFERGMFPFDKMITYYDFDDIQAAIADARSGRIIKPVLRF